jgi:hypothetical protein
MSAARIPLLTLILVALSGVANPAVAHSPYFTQVEKVTLPDGKPGEMRLLNGDGIFFSDPIRVLVLNSEGKPIALSPHSKSLVLVCNKARECVGVDRETDRVFQLDPASFRVEDVVVPAQEELWRSERGREELWRLEGRKDTWGFQVRGGSTTELTRAYHERARQMSFPLSIVLVLGIIVGVFAATWPGRRGKDVVVWAVGVGIRVLVIVCALFFSVLLAAIVGLDSDLGSSALIVGAGIPTILILWLRLRKRAVPEPST